MKIVEAESKQADALDALGAIDLQDALDAQDESSTSPRTRTRTRTRASSKRSHGAHGSGFGSVSVALDDVSPMEQLAVEESASAQAQADSKVFLYLEEILHGSEEYLYCQKGILRMVNDSYLTMWEFIRKVCFAIVSSLHCIALL